MDKLTIATYRSGTAVDNRPAESTQSVCTHANMFVSMCLWSGQGRLYNFTQWQCVIMNHFLVNLYFFFSFFVFCFFLFGFVHTEQIKPESFTQNSLLCLCVCVCFVVVVGFFFVFLQSFAFSS